MGFSPPFWSADDRVVAECVLSTKTVVPRDHDHRAVTAPPAVVGRAAAATAVGHAAVPLGEGDLEHADREGLGEGHQPFRRFFLQHHRVFPRTEANLCILDATLIKL